MRMSRERGGKFGGDFLSSTLNQGTALSIIFILFSHYNAPSAVMVLITLWLVSIFCLWPVVNFTASSQRLKGNQALTLKAWTKQGCITERSGSGWWIWWIFLYYRPPFFSMVFFFIWGAMISGGSHLHKVLAKCTPY